MAGWADSVWKKRVLAAGLGVASLILTWAVVVEAASHVLPRSAAAAIRPDSARLLARQAEAALQAGQADSATALARRSLRESPFNVRALRVLGIALAPTDAERAEQMVTLAGNWSLRDTPAHLWLAQERLKRGDFGSGIPHLDAVLRRREDLRPALFDLLARAGAAEPRALAVISERVALRPNWREDFLNHMLRTSDGQASALALAASLHAAGKGLDQDELSRVFGALVKASRFAAAEKLAEVVELKSRGVADGDFSGSERPSPLRWDIVGGAGATIEVVDDESRPGERALRVEYDGYSSPSLVRQMVFLSPGVYALRGDRRVDGDSARLTWRVRCAEGGRLLTSGSDAPSGRDGWRGFRMPFEIPRDRCDAQWVELAPAPGDRRQTVVAWFDNLAVQPRNQ